MQIFTEVENSLGNHSTNSMKKVAQKLAAADNHIQHVRQETELFNKKK